MFSVFKGLRLFRDKSNKIFLKNERAISYQRAGSRIAIFWFNDIRIFHRPHPSPNTDKGAVASIREWLESHGVTP